MIFPVIKTCLTLHLRHPRLGPGVSVPQAVLPSPLSAQVLWPYLLEFVTPIAFTNALTPLCKSLLHLAVKKQEEGDSASLIRYDLNGRYRWPWELGSHWAAPWEMFFDAFFPSFSSKPALAPRSDDAAAGEWPAGRALPSLVSGRSDGSSPVPCPDGAAQGQGDPRPPSLLLAGVPVPRTSSRSACPHPPCTPERLRVGWDSSGSLGTRGAVYMGRAVLQSPRYVLTGLWGAVPQPHEPGFAPLHRVCTP